MQADGQLPLEVSVTEAHARTRNGEAILIDVRETEEYAISPMPGAEQIPMGTVPQQLSRIEGLSDRKDLIVVCHHGVRSLHVAVWLREQGVPNAQTMQGGIDAWSRLIDASIPRY